VLCGLVAATFAALLYLVGLAANDARAGTEQAVEPAQAVAASEAPTGVAPPAKSPEMVIADQSAGTVASATQQQPTNIVISIRVNSPGNNGSISQTNLVIGDAGSSNTASTTQGSPADGSGQDASTDQQAGANATVTQDGAGNLVVVVRINSPGNNGPISQTNASVGSADAQNTSGTTQSEPTEASAPSTGATNAAGGTSARTSRRRPHRKVARAAPRREEAVATAPAPASPVAPALTPDRSDRTAAGAARAHHRSRHAVRANAADRDRSATRGGWFGGRLNTGPLGRAVADTGDLLGTVAPHAPLGAPQRPADVSSPVLSSLIAVLALTAVFVAWSFRPERFRPKRLPRGLLR
jgi:hypothetical protein